MNDQSPFRLLTNKKLLLLFPMAILIVILLGSPVHATMKLVSPTGGFLGSYYSKNPSVQYGTPGHNWNDWIVDPNGNDYWWQPVANANTTVLAFNWGLQGWIPYYPMGGWWTGTIQIQTSGYYVFGCENDDGLWVWLDRQTRPDPIIANRLGFAYSQPIFLTAGDHYIEVKYFEDFEWTGPIGASVLYLNMENRNCDLSVQKDDTYDVYDYDPRLPGQEIIYKTTVANGGAYTASNVVLNDSPPVNLEDLHYALNPQGPWSYWISPYNLSLGDIPPGGSVTIYTKGRVRDSSEPGVITNSVSVTSSVYDTDLANNSDTEDTIICDYKIEITPPESSNKVGDDHVFSVLLLKNIGYGWEPAPGESVHFSWSGVGEIVSPPSPATTDINGEISVTAHSDLTGLGTLTARYDYQIEDLIVFKNASADKEWIDYRISVTPPDSTNRVGDDHLFTILLEKNEGSGWLPADGESVDFGWSGVGGIVSPGSPAVTDASGYIQVTTHSDTTGSGTLTANFQRATDGSTIDISDSGDKLWIDYEIDVTPDMSTNEVGAEHIFTVTLTKNEGSGWLPADGESVDFGWSGVGGIVSPGSPAVTDASGYIQVTTHSDTTGSGTLTANFQRATDGSTIDISDSGTKQWIDYQIMVSPDESTNKAGDDHVFTALLEKNEGSGWVPATNEEVSFSWSGTTGYIVSPTSPQTTDADGAISVTVHSDDPGSGSLTANFETLTDSGMLTRSESGDKDWIDYRIDVTPPTADNNVGEPHLFTVFLERNEGGGWVPAPGETVKFFWTGVGIIVSPTSPCITNINGQFQVIVTSDDAGSGTMTTSFQKETDGSAIDITDSAEKTWISLATISGFKYDDSDGYGTCSPLEVKIPYWNSITLKDTEGNIVLKTITDQNGDFCFEDVSPGTYFVDEDPTQQHAIPDPFQPGCFLHSGWTKTAPPYQITVNYGDDRNVNIGNLWFGWIWGRATDEITGQPLSDCPITLLETGQKTMTDADGYYTFPELYPSCTKQYSGENYTVEITLPTGYNTHDSVTKFAIVCEREGTRVDFNAYKGGDSKTPRTIGFWKNWANHYTIEQMEAYIGLVKQASGLFTELSVANISTTYLSITKNSTMQDKAQAQLLASWLNVVSAKLGVDVVVNVGSIDGWELLIKSADVNGQVTVFDLLSEVDDYFQAVADGTLTLTKQSWEVIKDILDKLNNGQLF